MYVVVCGRLSIKGGIIHHCAEPLTGEAAAIDCAALGDCWENLVNGAHGITVWMNLYFDVMSTVIIMTMWIVQGRQGKEEVKKGGGKDRKSDTKANQCSA